MFAPLSSAVGNPASGRLNESRIENIVLAEPWIITMAQSERGQRDRRPEGRPSIVYHFVGKEMIVGLLLDRGLEANVVVNDRMGKQ
jgi:hypothetical protein